MGRLSAPRTRVAVRGSSPFPACGTLTYLDMEAALGASTRYSAEEALGWWPGAAGIIRPVRLRTIQEFRAPPVQLAPGAPRWLNSTFVTGEVPPLLISGDVHSGWLNFRRRCVVFGLPE